MKILWGMSASYCSFDQVLCACERMRQKKHDLQFVCTPNAMDKDSRFMKADMFKNKLTTYSDLPVIVSIWDAEVISFENLFDCMILAPCTANTLAKLMNGIYDNGLLVACKMMLRNQKPLILGFTSNDGLHISATNLAKALQMKHIYLVPLGQDAIDKKPNSLVCHWDLIEKTMEEAMQQKQLQPVLV